MQQQARSGQSISERTLEECWSTLQRVSWHLFQCVLSSSKSRGRAVAVVFQIRYLNILFFVFFFQSWLIYMVMFRFNKKQNNLFFQFALILKIEYKTDPPKRVLQINGVLVVNQLLVILMIRWVSIIIYVGIPIF